MKDNFSTKSDLYAKFRPSYPQRFYDYLNDLVNTKDAAWDCGTGTGQVAVALAKSFTQVYASDLSKSQITAAVQKSNISYSVQQAEKTNYSADQFDLITVAQALHWFDFEAFYREVRRTLKPSGLFCVMGYGNLQISEEINPILSEFYTDTIGSYWDIERKYIDEKYRTIPFPFKEIETPKFTLSLHWTLEHLIGYLNTWSAVKHYISKEKVNPVNEVYRKLKDQWGEDVTKQIRFPMLLRIGRLA